jgi:hypothetical protein
MVKGQELGLRKSCCSRKTCFFIYCCDTQINPETGGNFVFCVDLQFLSTSSALCPLASGGEGDNDQVGEMPQIDLIPEDRPCANLSSVRPK